MDYKVLYRKYRPQSFDDLVGQDHIKDLLLNSIINNKLAHAYIFTGPRGTGKTSTAKLFAKTINCEKSIEGIPCNKCIACKSYSDSADILEIDAASNNGVDEIRELRDNVKILPTFSKYKVYIIDEVHMLSSSAWNAFLKTLEEPPHHTIFILATTEIQKVPITVLSRCQRFDFQRINSTIITEHIKKVAEEEKINITEEALDEIASLADGGLRDALSMLDQLSKLGTEINVDTISSAYGILTKNELSEILENISKNNVSKVIELINAIQYKGVDALVFLNKMLDFLINEVIKNKSDQKNEKPTIDIKKIIFDLEECYGKTNQFILIKAVLLTNCECDNQKITVISDDRETSNNKKNNISVPPIISREIIAEQNDFKNDDELINIRINNAYVEASVALKKEFSVQWKKFLELLISEKEFKYVSLVKESNIEVVSPTNIILSNESYSNSVLFNSLSSEIEEKLNSYLNVSKKIVCLDNERWRKEKADYIANKKNKIYELISEPERTTNSESINSAENIFGNELIEIS